MSQPGFVSPGRVLGVVWGCHIGTFGELFVWDRSQEPVWDPFGVEKGDSHSIRGRSMSECWGFDDMWGWIKKLYHKIGGYFIIQLYQLWLRVQNESPKGLIATTCHTFFACCLVVTGTMEFWITFQKQLGMSSSQLISYFSGGLKPPISIWFYFITPDNVSTDQMSMR